MARVYKEKCFGRCPGDEPLTLTRLQSCELPQLYEVLEGRKSDCDQAHNLKGIKGKFSVFLFFFTFLSFDSLLL